MNLNEIKLIGRVTKDPELKALPSGVSVVKFSLATNYVYKNDNGDKIENTTFHNVVAFGRRAEVIAQYVVKGQELYVAGRQEHRSYDKEDGTKGYASEVKLESFDFGQKPKGYQGGENQEKQSTSAYDSMDVPEDDINPEDIPF